MSNINIIYRIAKRLARSKHLLADPDKYFTCEKRKPNPKVFLTEKNLQNCKVLPSREKLLDKMPRGGVCAEVGVAEGYYSRIILDVCNPRKLYMIEYNAEYVRNLRQRFSKEITDGVVEVLEGDSVEMLSTLPDNSLDFVYLDATHDYEHPKAELNVCKKKVKSEGIIAGHDYTRFSMWESGQYGVIEAVNEFAVANDYEMIYLTLDVLHSNSSYALKKITDE